MLPGNGIIKYNMSKPPLATLAIIIPAYNEASVIKKCLLSCINQTVPADEIIVVNNKSTDDTAKVVRAFSRQHPGSGVRLANQNKLQGIIPTRNYGFAVAKSDIYGRIDADSLIDPNWVEQTKLTFTDDATVAAASGPVRYHDMPAGRVVLKVDEQVRGALDRMSKGHKFLFGSNMSIRATAWDEIKADTCLDAEDIMHEDIDIAIHLYQHQLKIVYNPKMIGGMSARRIEDKPREFYNYVMRFDRTFKAHNVRSATARIPIVIYLLIYYPSRAVRKLYDPKTGRLSLDRLRQVREEQEITG